MRPQVTPTALDRFVTWIAPETGLRRMRARAAANVAALHLRRYDGAAKSRRTKGWLAGPHSPNAEIGPALHTLRNRTRELVRNNGWAAKAVRHLTNASVGSVGMIPSPITRSDALARRVMDLWEEWAGTTAVDPEGRSTFAGLQSLAAREAFEAGEVLIRRRRRRASDRLPVPLQLQILEPDHLDTLRTERRADGHVVIQGVEYDALGRRVAYWIFPNHPGDLLPIFGVRLTSERIPARDIIHLFEPLRAGQVRGVPRGCPALLRHRDFAEYEDAELVRSKIAALTVAFVIRDLEAKATVGGDDEIPVETMEPGTIEYLLPGEDVRFNTPPQVEGYEDYARVSLRAIAAAWGVSYESLTGDLTRVNFSSGRMGWLTEWRDIDAWRRLVLVPQLCDRVFAWFLEGAALVGALGSTEGVRARWTPPRREMIQPQTEIRAMKEQIETGLLSLSEALRQLGYDPRQVLEELRRDLELVKRLGLSTSLLAKLAEDVEAVDPSSDDDSPPPPGTPESRAFARNGAASLGALTTASGVERS